MSQLRTSVQRMNEGELREIAEGNPDNRRSRTDTQLLSLQFTARGGKAPVVSAGFQAKRFRLCGGERSGMDVYQAVFNDQVIAESGVAVLLEGNVYFPPESVRAEFLHRTRAKSLCPWKGVASYYAVEVDGVSDRNAAWTYRHPSPLARRIKDHVAFWHGVHVDVRHERPASGAG